jgi:hypothetical protein
MSKPRSIDRFGGDSGVAPRVRLLQHPGAVRFLTLPKINWNSIFVSARAMTRAGA